MIRKLFFWLISGILLLLIAFGILVAVFLLRSDSNVLPEAPVASYTSLEGIETRSYVAIDLVFPRSAIVGHLEDLIPREFDLEIDEEDLQIKGQPRRKQLTADIDTGNKSMTVGTPIEGKLQVNKQLNFLVFGSKISPPLNFDFDLKGRVAASVAPTFKEDWSIHPNISLSADVDQIKTKTVLGKVNLAETVKKPLNKILKQANLEIEQRLRKELQIRQELQTVWQQLTFVETIADDPKTWLRVTPEQVRFQGIEYIKDEIRTRVAIVFESAILVQNEKPELVAVPFPDLNLEKIQSNDFELTLPIEVSYEELNKQLRDNLNGEAISLSDEATVKIPSAVVAPFGDGVLLSADFSAKRRRLSAEGKLHLVGVPVFDPVQEQLRVEQLDFSIDTKSLLVQMASWFAHDFIVKELEASAKFSLHDELERVRKLARKKLDVFLGQLPEEVSIDLVNPKLTVDRIAFNSEGAFAIVKIKGRVSAKLVK